MQFALVEHSTYLERPGINITDKYFLKKNPKWPRHSPSSERKTKWLSHICKFDRFFLFVARKCSIYAFSIVCGTEHTCMMFIYHRLT